MITPRAMGLHDGQCSAPSTCFVRTVTMCALQLVVVRFFPAFLIGLLGSGLGVVGGLFMGAYLSPRLVRDLWRRQVGCALGREPGRQTPPPPAGGKQLTAASDAAPLRQQSPLDAARAAAAATTAPPATLRPAAAAAAKEVVATPIDTASSSSGSTVAPYLCVQTAAGSTLTPATAAVGTQATSLAGTQLDAADGTPAAASAAAAADCLAASSTQGSVLIALDGGAPSSAVEQLCEGQGQATEHVHAQRQQQQQPSRLGTPVTNHTARGSARNPWEEESRWAHAVIMKHTDSTDVEACKYSTMCQDSLPARL